MYHKTLKEVFVALDTQELINQYMSINRVTLIGNVGKDPEVKHLENNLTVANFSLATTERGYTTKSGKEIPDRTDWHSIVVWGGLAKVIEKYVKKGSAIYVEGKIRYRYYEKDGVKHWVTEIYSDTIDLLGNRHPDNKADAQADMIHNTDPEPTDDLPF